jgi:Tfp pilus assembly protein PilO
MKFKNREQMLMALAIGAAGLFIAVNFIFTPLAGWWSARQTEIKHLREQVKAGNTLVGREKFVRGQWDDMQKNSLAANTSAAEQQFLRALENWSRDSGAEVTSIMPQWKNDSTNYFTLNCRVEAAGDLGSLSKLLYAIEKGPLAVKPDDIELTARDATGQQMTLALELNGLALQARDKK